MSVCVGRCHIRSSPQCSKRNVEEKFPPVPEHLCDQSNCHWKLLMWKPTRNLDNFYVSFGDDYEPSTETNLSATPRLVTSTVLLYLECHQPHKVKDCAIVRPCSDRCIKRHSCSQSRSCEKKAFRGGNFEGGKLTVSYISDFLGNTVHFYHLRAVEGQ